MSFGLTPKNALRSLCFAAIHAEEGRRVVVAVYLPEPNPDKRQLEKNVKFHVVSIGKIMSISSSDLLKKCAIVIQNRLDVKSLT